MFRRIVSLYQNLYITSSISSSSLSSREIYSRMKQLMDSKEYKKTLDFFDQQSHSCTDFEINLALKACISLNEYQCGMNIQKTLSQNSLNNPYIQATLIQFYSLISNNMPTKVLDLFDEMNIEPNQAILAVLFSACSRVGNDRAMKIGRKLLNQMPKNFLNDNKLLTSAINMLMRFGDNIITYATMMNGYNINNEPLKSLKLFEDMKRDDINADAIVLIILIGACAPIGMLSKCQSIVAQIPLHFYENQRICNFIN
ncbi:unnamed protein product [Rotaria magnacalcarata]|uniref:Pentatricopeptide repeat-containing protein n=1 Tax=Rotaria magnacalcarata TaxID=392030 RepID=A0A816ULQ0_9BILA|nr:unnamed protein product [Rotaria magnacalcarata]